MKFLSRTLLCCIFLTTACAHTTKKRTTTIIASVCSGALIAIIGYKLFRLHKKKKLEEQTTTSLLRILDKPESYSDTYSFHQALLNALREGANPNQKMRNSIPPSINNTTAIELAIQKKLTIQTFKLLLIHGAQFTNADIENAKDDLPRVHQLLNKWRESPDKNKLEEECTILQSFYASSEHSFQIATGNTPHPQQGIFISDQSSLDLDSSSLDSPSNRENTDPLTHSSTEGTSPSGSPPTLSRAYTIDT